MISLLWESKAAIWQKSVIQNPTQTKIVFRPDWADGEALPLPLLQSVVIVAPFMISLIAITFVCFGICYAVFMRQEIRSDVNVGAKIYAPAPIYIIFCMISALSRAQERVELFQGSSRRVGRAGAEDFYP